MEHTWGQCSPGYTGQSPESLTVHISKGLPGSTPPECYNFYRHLCLLDLDFLETKPSFRLLYKNINLSDFWSQILNWSQIVGVKFSESNPLKLVQLTAEFGTMCSMAAVLVKCGTMPESYYICIYKYGRNMSDCFMHTYF